MVRHLTITLADDEDGQQLIEELEHNFRNFDYRRPVASLGGEPPRMICRWNGLPYNTALLLLKSLFENPLIGSVSFAEAKDDDRTIIQTGGGLSETIGVSVVRSRRLAE